MADRFAAGGRLYVFGTGPAATDAAHVAVEFVHPVIVGKRGLPALALGAPTGTDQGLDSPFAHQLHLLGSAADVALGISRGGTGAATTAGLAEAGRLAMLRVALTSPPTSGPGPGGPPPEVEHLLEVPSSDPLVARELQVSAYHLLWELVHVFLEQARRERR